MKTQVKNNPNVTMVIGIALALLLVAGLVHLLDAPDAYEEAVYKGVLFMLNAIGAVIASYGIWKNKRWGWVIGLAISIGSILGYVASRTVGMPQIPAEPDAWLEPLGVISLLTEGVFIAIGIWVMQLDFRIEN